MADEVRGRDAYLARMPDLRAAGAELTVTQALKISVTANKNISSLGSQ